MDRPRLPLQAGLAVALAMLPLRALPAPPAAPVAAADYRSIPGGVLRSVLPADGVASDALVAPYELRRLPVTNADFRAFLELHPEWRRNLAPPLFVAPTYLSGWRGATDTGTLADNAPVVRVSWFAASAYCASEGARLPRWYEWELAAKADARRADARDDPAWLAAILDWYANAGKSPPGAVGSGAANIYGIHDLHGLMWEWVEDYDGLFVNVDSRASGDRKLLDYCGGAAVTLADRRNYAVLMRLALLAAMESQQDGANLGFRCARDAPFPPAQTAAEIQYR
jgi:formylglycine-generating enzyme required for sulfatase activity